VRSTEPRFFSKKTSYKYDLLWVSTNIIFTCYNGKKGDHFMQKIVTALVGYGMSGQLFHLPQLIGHQNFIVKTVMTRNTENQSKIKAALPEVCIVSDYEDILNDPDISLVILAVSNDVHYDYTKRALLKDKHVICEKPFVQSVEEAIDLFGLAHQRQRLLRVFHNRKYDGDILTVEKLIQEKPFGQIIAFHARFDRYVPNIKDNWRYKPGYMSGIFYDLAPHIVHHCVYLFGQPMAVFNRIHMDRPGSQTDDHFELMLIYQNMTCYVGAEPYEREPMPKLKLVGTEATYVKYGFDQPEVVTQPNLDLYTQEPHQSFYIDQPNHKITIPVLLGKHYAFYDKVYDDIVKPKALDEDEICAISVIKIMEKAMISAKEGRIILL
jgi:scyllo-inositol 2-dehydrogenase (NADP+)